MQLLIFMLGITIYEEIKKQAKMLNDLKVDAIIAC